MSTYSKNSLKDPGVFFIKGKDLTKIIRNSPLAIETLPGTKTTGSQNK
jgi:hypothetical protein